MEDKGVLIKTLRQKVLIAILVGGLFSNYSLAWSGESVPSQAENRPFKARYILADPSINDAETVDKFGLEAVLKGIWTAMTDALKKGNNVLALSYIHPHSQPTYQKIFTVLGDHLPTITATQKDFRLISFAERWAKCELLTVEGGKTYSYEVIFIKEDDGSWKIWEY